MSKHLPVGVSPRTIHVASHETRSHLVTPQRRPLLIVLTALIFMVAVWFSLAFIVPRPPTVDQRVHAIAAQLRCPVCQNESLADATAPVALDLRQQIRQQVLADKSDQQIIQFFIARYGEQTIVWAPQWQGFSLLIWLVPIALLLGGCVLIYLIIRDWQAGTVQYQVSRRRMSNGTITGALAVEQDAGTTSSTVMLHEQRNFTVDESGLERYRGLLEQELAAEDPLFRQSQVEAEEA
jgi:Uncharacterized protein involved in biosynthesis of c-type cytochromes